MPIGTKDSPDSTNDTGAGRCRAALLALAFLCLAAAGRAEAAQWFVELVGVEFAPASLTIAAGDTVTFVNTGGYHNVVADDGSFRCAHGCDGDGSGGNGNASSLLWVVTVAFPNPGTVGYFCEPHGSPGSGMAGTIEVLAPAAPVTAAPVGSALFAILLIAALTAAATSRLRRHAGADQPNAAKL